MMADNTLDKIIREVGSLPPEQQQRLIQLLAERISQPSQKKTIEQIASEQGKRPLKFSEIRELGSFFPDDENVDDLVKMVQTLRQDKSARDLD
jgi:hypothetical protein